MQRLVTYIVIAILSVPLVSTPVSASDQDKVRAAVQSGIARPLGELLPSVRAQFPGRMLDATLVERGRQVLYEIKILGPDGHVSNIFIDARTGAVRGVQGQTR